MGRHIGTLGAVSGSAELIIGVLLDPSDTHDRDKHAEDRT